MKFNGQTYSMGKAEQDKLSQEYSMVEQSQYTQQPQLELQQKTQDMSYAQLVDLTKKVNKANPVGHISQSDIARYAAILQQPSNINNSGINQMPVNMPYAPYDAQQTQNRQTRRKFSLKNSPLPGFLGAFLVMFNLVIPTALVVKHLKGDIPGDILSSNNPQSALIVVILTILAIAGIAVLIHNYDYDDEIM